MRILVTGATGFVGQHLLPYLEKQGHEVYALVRPSTDGSKVYTNHLYVFEDDIEHLASYLLENHVDGIIHLASLYIAQHKPADIKNIVTSNVYLGTAVMEAAIKAGVKWFLNTGTIWQNYNVEPYSDKYCPVNLYAASKQAFMDMAKYYTEVSDIRFCTLKLCDTYGANDTRRKIFALFEQIAKSGECLKMSPGDQKLDIVHIDNVVRDFEALAEKLDNGEQLREEYVVSSGRQKSLKEIAKQYEIDHQVILNIEWGGRPYRKREVMVPYIGHQLPK
nr:NAD(P)-dependent oxidoreductase [uncultured Prevotella sp.]